MSNSQQDWKEQILKELSLSVILRGVLLLKPGRPQFKEEALEYALQKLAQEDERYNSFFILHGDGTSPEANTGLENFLAFTKMGHLLQETDDWQYVYLTTYGRVYLEQHLKGEYGDNILGVLEPLAAKIWGYASEYEARRRGEF